MAAYEIDQLSPACTAVADLVPWRAAGGFGHSLFDCRMGDLVECSLDSGADGADGATDAPIAMDSSTADAPATSDAPLDGPAQ